MGIDDPAWVIGYRRRGAGEEKMFNWYFISRVRLKSLLKDRMRTGDALLLDQ